MDEHVDRAEHDQAAPLAEGASQATQQGQAAASLASAADALASAQTQLAEANARVADLAARLGMEKWSRQLRDGLEDAGVVRARDALRAAQAMVGHGDADSDAISTVIERVRAAHPEYFAHANWPSTNAPNAASNSGATHAANDAPALAARARASNDRRALLDYLRARRAP